MTRTPSRSVSGGWSTTGWPGVEAFGQLCVGGIALTDFDKLRPYATAFDPEDGPRVAAPEQAADGHLQDVRTFPHDDSHFDTVGIPERLGRDCGIDEIGEDVHALLLHAERGDLREAGRLHAPYAAFERPAATPLFDEHASVRRNADRVGRQQVCDDLQARGSPTMFRSVDLPDPDGPSSTTKCPSWSTRLTWRRA
jgi:hypothetical protein